jgi:hypothetical protein
MSRLGRMPSWQKWFALSSMLACSLSGTAYLMGHQFSLQKQWLGIHSVLAWHGITAMLAILALGSVLPFHLKAGLKAKRKMVSGLSQLLFLSILTISGVLLYYGPAEIRDDVIVIHWLIGLLFFAIFIFHGVITQLNPRTN